MINSWQQSDCAVDWTPEHLLKDALASGAVDGDVIVDITTCKNEKTYLSDSEEPDFFPVWYVHNCSLQPAKPNYSHTDHTLKLLPVAWQRMMDVSFDGKAAQSYVKPEHGATRHTKLTVAKCKELVGSVLYSLTPHKSGSVFTYSALSPDNSVVKWFQFFCEPLPCKTKELYE